MKSIYDRKALGSSSATGLVAVLAGVILSAPCGAATLFSQGFEGGDTTDWIGAISAVTSGTDGINAASGSWFGLVGNDPGGNTFTRTHFGGYNTVTSGDGYSTSIDIYLDVTGDVTNGVPNDTRFDWDNAVDSLDTSFAQDFVFNAGFYTNADGSGDPGFIISASNNAGRGSSYPNNPGRGPISITKTGWYTFQDNFYNSGGYVFVEMIILDSLGNLVNEWTLPVSNPPGADASNCCFNRYGAFANQEFQTLAIDNGSLSTSTSTPEPSNWLLTVFAVAAFTFFARKQVGIQL